MTPLAKLLIGFAVFAGSVLLYEAIGTPRAWFVLMAGTVLFTLALAEDERGRS